MGRPPTSPTAQQEPNRGPAHSPKRRVLEAGLAIYKKLGLPEGLRHSINQKLDRFAPTLAHDVRRAAGVVMLPDDALHEIPLRYTLEGFPTAWQQVLEAVRDRAGGHAVTHIVALPFFGRGGAQKVAAALARSLARQSGGAVILMATDSVRGDAPEFGRESRVCVLDLPSLAPGASLIQREAFITALVFHFAPHRLHNVNSETVWSLFGRAGDVLGEQARLSASIFAYQFDQDGRETRGYAAKFLPVGLEVCDAVLTDNQRFADMAAERLDLSDAEKARIHVIYNSVDAPQRQSPQQTGPHQRRPEERGEGDAARVVWAGRLDADKRFGQLVSVAERMPDTEFHVYGERVLADTPADPLNSAPGNVRYQGPFTPADVAGFGRYGALVFTSNWEGLPNLLLEAGAAGVPVVAPRVGGIGELVTPDTGYPLNEAAGAGDYAAALRDALAQPAAARRRAKALQRLIARRHSRASFDSALAAVPDLVGGPAARARTDRAQGEGRLPLVSVIIPYYSHGPYLLPAVQSARAAYRGPLDIIVVDDGSPEARADQYLAHLQHMEPGLSVVRQENRGLAGARNTGLDHARGEYVQFLDSDDLLAPSKIDRQVAHFRDVPDLDVSACDYILWDTETDRMRGDGDPVGRMALSLHNFLYYWERGLSVPIHCALLRRDAVGEQRFETTLRAKEDWAFWCTLAARGARFAHTPVIGALYRLHGGNMTRADTQAMADNFLLAVEVIADQLPGNEVEPFRRASHAWARQSYGGQKRAAA